MPRIIGLVQGEESWMEWRRGGIGCSDIAAAMEESPFMTAYSLWLLKTGQSEPKPQNDAMIHGVKSEARARDWYLRRKGMPFTPVCAVHDHYDYIRASVDGWNGRRRMGVEIKCPTTATAFRRAEEGHIPWYYYLQIQGEMEVLNADEWDYCCWFEDDGVIIPVERDHELWGMEIQPMLAEFWDRVLKCEWPIPEGDAVQESLAWEVAAGEWMEAQSVIAGAQDQQQRALATLRRLSTARINSGGGLRTHWEQWRPRSTVTLTADTPEAADEALALIWNNPELRRLVREDKDGPKIWQSDYPPNLIMKVDRTTRGAK